MKKLPYVLLLLLAGCTGGSPSNWWEGAVELKPVVNFQSLESQWEVIVENAVVVPDRPDERALFRVDYGGYGIVGVEQKPFTESLSSVILLHLAWYKGSEIRLDELPIFLYKRQNQIGPGNEIRVTGPEGEIGLEEGEHVVLIKESGLAKMPQEGQ